MWNRRLVPVPGCDVRDALRRGQLVVDRIFDGVFPLNARRRSSVYWTPVEVAVRAARLLAVEPRSSILDVGAGVGKFCIIAAAVLEHAHVRGIEHRPHLVRMARAAASEIAVDVDFDHGTLEGQDPSRVDGIYMFNPFAENLCAYDDRLDDTVELSEERYRHDIALAEDFLRAARAGTRVITYCGFGGTIPAAYRLVQRESRAGTLELWVKSQPKTVSLSPSISQNQPNVRQFLAVQKNPSNEPFAR